MIISCVVVDCTHRFRKDCGIKFHRIPLDAKRRAKWLQAINRKQWTPSHSGDCVCGVHFISGSASSKEADPNYIPHVNIRYQKASVLFSPEAKKDRYTRAVRREGEKNLNMMKKAEVMLHQPCWELYEPQAIVQDTSDGTLEKENFTRSDIHDHCLRKITLLTKENRQLLDEVETLQHELNDANEKNGVRFCDSFLSGHNKNARTSFFTGIPNCNILVGSSVLFFYIANIWGSKCSYHCNDDIAEIVT